MAALNTAIIAELDDALSDFDLSDTGKAIEHDQAPAGLPGSAAPVVLANQADLEAFYGSVDQEQAAELQAVAARIKERDRAARAGIIETGNDLISIKDSIPGHFDSWLKVEFDMSKSTAWNYINAAQEFGDVPKVIEILPPATVYKLAAKATPADVREAVVLEITSGAILSKQEVERRIAVARSEAAEQERARKNAEREQSDAERQKREDEQAWQARVKELAEEGKTEPEIQKERQKWDTSKAKKERDKDKRQEAKRKRDEELKNEHEADRAECERKRQIARDAALFLRQRLGPDFDAFRSMMADSPWYEFQSAVLSDEKKEIAYV